MSLGPGTRLGPYEVQSALGAGGMGEVYKARDTRLDRLVAIKVLPPHVSGDPALRERFEREARTVAALNHPHICTLHDVGRQDDVEYLVLEYLEGQTLADRLMKGALPLGQAIAIAIQIADALDRAHRAGIVHRDLKPANIMLVRRGGPSGPPDVKLLDFGLAKVTPAVVAASGLSVAPTGVTPVTIEGTLLGTLQYMAPEQIEGQEADARTDIFAFGAVVYEMLTGRKAFEGKTQAGLIGAILKDTPRSIVSLQPLAPAVLDRIVTTCLAKDPDDRWQSARDLLRELRWVASVEGKASHPVTPARAFAKRAWFAFAACAMVAAVTIPLSILHLRESTPEPHAVRFSVTTPSARGVPNHLALSPDGRTLAFAAYDERGTESIWVRPLDALTSQPLGGTEGAQGLFWSPDSRVIGFFADGKLKKISVAGGAAQTLCDLPAAAQRSLGSEGATWNSDGVILFASAGALYRVSSAGGTPAPVLRPDATEQERFRDPYFLPDKRHFVYLAINRDHQERTGIYAGSLDSRTSTLLVSSLTKAEYAPSGHLLFVREGTLMALAFDPKRLQVVGEPVPIAEHVTAGNLAGFSVSRAGVLAYRERNDSVEADSRLVWFDRAGKEVGSIGESGRYRDPALSPDGKRLAVARRDPRLNTDDVWVFDVIRGTGSRMTFDAHSEWQPLWSPDGSRLAFVSGGSATQMGPNVASIVFWKSPSGIGADETLFTSPSVLRLDDWSPDGHFLLVSQRSVDKQTLLTVPFGDGAKPQSLFSTRSAIRDARLSPDARWIAYTSDEGGREEVYVQPFPSGGGKRQISADGGSQPAWRSDGRELFYLGDDGAMMSVQVDAVPAFEAGIPLMLFRASIGGLIGMRHYAVSSDGQRFLVVTQVQQQTEPPINVIVEWPHALTK